MNEQRLHAHVDDALPEPERTEVEAWLANDPAARARVNAYRAQNQALHELYDPVLTEPHAVGIPAHEPAPLVARLRWGFALTATLVVGIAIGVVLGNDWRTEVARGAPLARQATLAYAAYQPEIRHPVEVTAAEEQHLVAWLSKRLTAPLKVPVLASAGYRLLGGRLLPATARGDSSPVAQLMYENAQGKRLTLLVKRDDSNTDTAFRFLKEGNTQVFYWVDKPFGYALAGDLSREELHPLAQLVYRQINP
jgi:anti-sigma factor RsiW